MGQRTHEVQRLVDDSTDMHGFGANRHCPGLDPRDIQDVVDELKQMASAFENVTDRFGIIGALESAREKLAEPENGVKWSSGARGSSSIRIRSLRRSPRVQSPLPHGGLLPRVFAH